MLSVLSVLSTWTPFFSARFRHSLTVSLEHTLARSLATTPLSCSPQFELDSPRIKRREHSSLTPSSRLSLLTLPNDNADPISRLASHPASSPSRLLSTFLDRRPPLLLSRLLPPSFDVVSRPLDLSRRQLSRSVALVHRKLSQQQRYSFWSESSLASPPPSFPGHIRICTPVEDLGRQSLLRLAYATLVSSHPAQPNLPLRPGLTLPSHPPES